MRTNILVIVLTLSLIGMACKGKLKPVERKFSNGIIAKYSVDKFNKIQGDYFEYYPSNKLRMKKKFANGKEEGKVLHFYESGQIREVQFFEDGNLEGVDSIFGEDGRLTNLANYKAGLKNGKFIKFKDSTNTPDIESIYESDKLISVKKY